VWGGAPPRDNEADPRPATTALDGVGHGSVAPTFTVSDGHLRLASPEVSGTVAQPDPAESVPAVSVPAVSVPAAGTGGKVSTRPLLSTR
jgi:hypothetical protein